MLWSAAAMPASMARLATWFVSFHVSGSAPSPLAASVTNPEWQVLPTPGPEMMRLPWHLTRRGSLSPQRIRGEPFMAPTTTNGQERKTLASQLDRLDSILDALSDGLNQAVATAVEGAVERAVRQAVGQAVKQTMHA